MVDVRRAKKIRTIPGSRSIKVRHGFVMVDAIKVTNAMAGFDPFKERRLGKFPSLPGLYIGLQGLFCS